MIVIAVALVVFWIGVLFGVLNDEEGGVLAVPAVFTVFFIILAALKGIGAF